ncbi:MAG TPA: ABC transporter permease [Thermomicrobiales bacterium]|nr:ABC transporter permease [Thermomicrobiales bacterium]
MAGIRPPPLPRLIPEKRSPMSATNVEPAQGQPYQDDRLQQTSVLRRVLLRPEVGAMVGAVALWTYFAVVAGDRGFLSTRGTASYLEVSAQLGILAIAVSMLMISGEFDLSIGSTIGASGMVIAILAVEYELNLWLAMLASLAVALVIGFINGVLVRWSRLPSFIITLATLFIIRGLTIALTRLETGRTNVGDVDEAAGFASAKRIFDADVSILGGNFPISIFWWLGLTAVATWILMRTPFGNWIFGAGGNEQAARNVGVPVNRVKISLFMTTAAAAWLVAVIQVISTTGADVLRGTQQEFFAIIAVVIGGTLLTGGYGSAIGAAIGALIFGMVRQGIVFAGVDADWFQVFLGGMVLVAVLINRYVRARATRER